MTLEQYIEQNILPQYDAFDGGHLPVHRRQDGYYFVLLGNQRIEFPGTQ